MGLPEALHLKHRIHVRRGDLGRHSFDEAHLEATARDHVDGRELLGDAQRIWSVCDRVSEHEKSGPLRDPCQDRERNHSSGRHACRRRMMLVDHDVETELVCELPLVVVPMEEIGSPGRVEMPVRKVHPERPLMLVPGVGVWLLGELEHSHEMCVSP